MKNINLPTKITISRIILATLLIIFVILTYILDQFEVINVAETFNIYLTNSTFESVVVGPNYTGPKINGLNLIIFGVFIIGLKKMVIKNDFENFFEKKFFQLFSVMHRYPAEILGICFA